MFIMDLKSKIKNAIKMQGLTLEQVAAQMKRPDGSTGLAQSALSQMLANGNPSYNKLEEIAGIIGLSVSELLKDEYKDRHETEDSNKGCYVAEGQRLKESRRVKCPHCHKDLIITIEEAEL